MSKCASYLNTISKQNRIKHRNRFQMLVRTCFLVDCLSLTSSIALKIVVFLKKKSIYWQCQRYSFDVLESFLDVFLGLSFNQGYNVYNTFYSVLYWVTKMSNKKSLEWRIPYNYAPLWSQSCSGSPTFQFSVILMSQPINPLD